MQVKNPLLRSKIIEVSRKIFFEVGYKNASIKDIAINAHTSISNIYTYFYSKQELFNEVIGDAPFQIDTYIQKYYKDIVESMCMLDKWVNIDIFPEKMPSFTIKERMTFSILLNGSKGTIYEHYQDGLLNILRDYTKQYLGETVNLVLVEIIVYAFISKLIMTPQEIEEVNGKKSQFKSDVYRMKLDTKNKILEVVILNKIPYTQIFLKCFQDKYHALIATINTTQYSLIIDCRGLPSITPNSFIIGILECYHKSKFNKVSCIFSKEQVALEIQGKRLFKAMGFNNFEVIIK